MHRFGKRSWLLGLALAATIGATVLVATASARTHATVTVTFWNEMNDQEFATAQTLVTQFEASHPDIKIDMTEIPFSGRPEVLHGRAGRSGARHHPPDNAPDVQGLAAQGLLTDLTSMVSAADKADFVPGGPSRAASTTGSSTPSRRPSTRWRSTTTSRCSSRRHQEPAGDAGAARRRLPEVRRRQGDLPERGFLLGPAVDLGLRRRPRQHVKEADPGQQSTSRSPAGRRSTRCSRTSARSRTRTSRTATRTCMTAFKNGQVAMIVNGPWASCGRPLGAAFKSSTNLSVAVLPPGPGGQGSPIGGGALAISRNSQNVRGRVHVHPVADVPGAAGGLRGQEQRPPEPISRPTSCRP